MTTTCVRACHLRPLLKGRIDQRVQDLIDDHMPNPEKTLVYYWIKNGALGERFHNFLAFSQWSTTLYNMMARLVATHGDLAVRS